MVAPKKKGTVHKGQVKSLKKKQMSDNMASKISRETKNRGAGRKK